MYARADPGPSALPRDPDAVHRVGHHSLPSVPEDREGEPARDSRTGKSRPATCPCRTAFVASSGGNDVLRGQLEHLLLVGAQRNVELQITPTACDDNAGVNGPSTVVMRGDGKRFRYVEARGPASSPPSATSDICTREEPCPSPQAERQGSSASAQDPPVSTSFPVTRPVSPTACALAASASGNTPSTCARSAPEEANSATAFIPA